ncbi:PstS family phosphate ABC transporter substrate-binding protein [Flavobacterium sp. I3-2]|uniref:PstS family phosphate ABC transporter substrate-binding protein n=1 Tax=Flavobacterium sp. I3-2 TaxID=2748319 RepID=UPI0015B2C877|nr:substrate-binding domain-containing protein [Flavobacterium sp. I3-2]
MKKYLLGIGFFAFTGLLICCKKESENQVVEETYATGTTSVFVEESIVPIFDDINKVFMNTYDKATINIIPKTENEIVNYMLQDSVKIAVLPRKLNEKELKHFEGKKNVNQTPFAKDAIIFVNAKSSSDSLIDVKTIVDLIKNPKSQADHVIVFDNINSSLSQYFKNKAGVSEFGDNVYFAKDTKEVVEYTSKNNKAIGIVGINWLLQPNQEIANLKQNLKSMSVLNESDNKYYRPSQSTIADGSYPLIRELYVIEAQGVSGLGKGVSSFAASDRGQRIVLKSGLFPYKQPTREIIINEN